MSFVQIKDKISIASKVPDQKSIHEDGTNASIIDQKLIFHIMRYTIKEGIMGF